VRGVCEAHGGEQHRCSHPKPLPHEDLTLICVHRLHLVPAAVWSTGRQRPCLPRARLQRLACRGQAHTPLHHWPAARPQGPASANCCGASAFCPFLRCSTVDAHADAGNCIMCQARIMCQCDRHASCDSVRKLYAYDSVKASSMPPSVQRCLPT
jgi:hypothetical protein